MLKVGILISHYFYITNRFLVWFNLNEPIYDYRTESSIVVSSEAAIDAEKGKDRMP